MPFLEGLGTAVPGDPIPQSAIKAKAEGLLRDVAPQLLDHLDVFDTTGIQSRHFVRPMDWYLETHGWKERSDVYREEGMALIEAASRDALLSAKLEPHDLDGIVFVSTTGISTPSLDARLINRMKLRSDVQRVPVWGLGCAGGVAGFRLADQLARANPKGRYLLLSLEICSLSFDLAGMDLRTFIATTLFADGAGAAIIAGDNASHRRLGETMGGDAHEWPDTETVMGWDVEDSGLAVVFSRKIPEIVEREFAPVVDRYLKRTNIRPDRFVFHPGGTKVLAAYQSALGLQSGQLDASRRVLTRYGNMSSPSVIFTLKQSLEKPLAPNETALLAALGPGFASELALIRGAA